MAAPERVGVFRALQHRFAVEVDGTMPVDPAVVLGDLLDPSIGADDPVDAVYTLDFPTEEDSGTLSRDGALISAGRARVLLQVLISQLGRAFADQDPGGGVHAVTLRAPDGAGTIVLAGASTHGKSTMSTRLLLDGFALVAEDITVIDPATLTVEAFHRPLGLSETSFDLLGIDIPPAAGEPCGCGSKVLVTPAMLGAPLAPPSRPTVVAMVDKTSATLTRVSPATMLSKMLEAGVAPLPEPARDLDTLIRLLASCQCVIVGTEDLDQAAGWLRQLAAASPPEPTPSLVETHPDRIDVYCGREAVLVEGERSHLLNQTAAATWLLHNEGLSPDAIAAELSADRAVIDAALAQLIDR